jgi:cell division protein FtsL
MGFTDMMSSGRGPGVIGMLLAMVVLVGFGTLFMFAFDEGFQGADMSIEAVIAHQAKEIDDLKLGIGAGTKRLAEAPARNASARELSTLKRENQYRDGEITSLGEGIAAAQQAITARLADFEAYKDQYRTVARAKGKGTTMAKLETRKGDVYENVQVREVSAVGMQIIHDGGQKRIPFEELPAEIQDLYQFDPGQKAAAIAKEAEERGTHDAAVAAAQQAAGQQAMAQKEKDDIAARERAAAALKVMQSRIFTLGEEIRGLEEALVLEVRKPLSRAPQMRQQISNKQRERAGLEEKVARLMATP